MPETLDSSLQPWLSYHLFYHGDRNLALEKFLWPEAAKLLSMGEIESLFFVRHELGGPHLRVRVRIALGSSAVGDKLAAAATAFLAAHPSQESLAAEIIARNNQSILAWDPHENDDSIYPDNSFIAFPFRPEIERYGGVDLLQPSLAFFAISSLQAFKFTLSLGNASRSRQLAEAFRILARQALGLASDRDELLPLLGYAGGAWGLAALHSEGDLAFEQQREKLSATLCVEADASLSTPAIETESGRRLARRICSADTETRHRIKISQMHMTANRLGLTNPDEVYLSRMLWRACQALAESNPLLWDRLAESFSEPAAARVERSDRLEDLISQAFAQLYRAGKTL
ncbi:MAG TPA: lantibiotic dehydratase C-terminal domain-containing protein [Thermoanaerobaculia bacterium]|nr:lantibiotic dehydratase C-terminal domain-containing protein [Thermoanaerobaculia bacterium]